jgi:Rrf2 family iron-sulfur cluster assembly transcriptional regulator
MFSKTTRLAISAMTALSETHGTANPTLTASQIAEARDIPSPFVAKLMTTLSMRGLVNGTRGPGGGYSLARAPRDISLLDIASSFQRLHEPECPLGRAHVCDSGARCALHDPLHQLQETYNRFLAETTLAGFGPEAKLAINPTTTRHPRRASRRKAT